MRRMEMKRVLSLIVVSILLAGLIWGCVAWPGGKSTSETRGANEFPTGRFVQEPYAFWAFEFDEDGTWRGYEGDFPQPSISGKYGVTGNLYTEMTHDYLSSPKIPATYFWEFDGKKLIFKLWGEDVNAHRKSVYDGQTYIWVE
jgi:hypothetical protein